ncbi:MAG: anti-sigma factor domain-containing protein [Clostridiales bacterium]|nr:anti-sigma factor domain-containing protein [Clostridiales bacterium]
MKGIVIEILEDNLILLNEEGEFIESKKSSFNYQIGDEISYEMKDHSRNMMSRYIAMAASILIFFTSGVGFAAYYTPYGYINIDINPSMEITYNRFERVLNIRGVNQEGIEIVDKLDNYRHQSVEIAVKDIINDVEEMGYFIENVENIVLITVNDKHSNETIVDGIVVDITDNLVAPDVIVTNGIMEDHTRYQLINEKFEISPGKLNLIDRITEENGKESDKADVTKYQNHSEKTVKELVEEVEETNKEQKIYEIKGKQSMNSNGEKNEIIEENENSNSDDKNDSSNMDGKNGGSNSSGGTGKK